MDEGFDRKAHWEEVYRTKSDREVSWFQPDPRLSLELIAATEIGRDGPVIDIGGGASRLVDVLLANGYDDVSVLDLSGEALRTSQRRLGALQARVSWFEQDVTRFVPPRRFSVWHDRAVFHFLTEPADREAYRTVLERAVRPGGQVIIAAFAPDGPERCSGLEVVRYAPETLAAELGQGFQLLEHRTEAHRTPAGKIQKFSYCRFVKLH
ncbi:class I SAM-dependent methyltransferase [Thiohalomonas denitrificans]|uniref:class I SAM-dependent methyltransferase n=1 Tax=Thiohalomonas denitrificans TaxID=415747 RepID=UPI0026E9E46F|nr:class I SAM-dependent methyltransferase [Thiohalomonas denitrificans]